MKTIQLNDVADRTALAAEVAAVLEQGGIVCMPCGGKYRLFVDLTNEGAVLDLMQSKRRVHKAPALVFIDREEMLTQVAGEVEPLALRLARRFWPKLFTIRVQPSDELPAVVRKQLGGSRAKVGVRIPEDPVAREVVARLGRPVLASSANPENKKGEGSSAQVRKNFGGRVSLFIDTGDLSPEPASTVVEIAGGAVEIRRQGSVSAEEIEQAARE